ncbi:MAG: hypothetical protein WCO84_00925 [bacterium]
MKKTISQDEFVQAFDDYGRGDNFSIQGRIELFDYLEGYEDSTGVDIELDIVALCCDFTEYKNLQEFQDNYGSDFESFEDIEQATNLIMIDTESFLIQDF